MEGGGGRDRKRGRETWRGRGRRRGTGIVRGEGEGEETEKEKGTLLHRLDAAAFEGGDALPLAAVLHVRARLAHPGSGGGGGGGGFACGPWRRRRWRHERHVVHPPAALAPHLRRGGSLCCIGGELVLLNTSFSISWSQTSEGSKTFEASV